jgi:CRP-like cAMP-binding protein
MLLVRMTEELPAGRLLAILSHTDLLCGIPSERLAALATQGQRCTFQPGSVLVRQGATAECVHVLLSGRVRLERAHPQFVQPVVLAELEQGHLVGAVGFFARQAQPMTATAIEKTETLSLTAAALADTLGGCEETWTTRSPWLTWRSPLDFVALYERPPASAAAAAKCRG